ncbi:LPXTG cell wall anchor domain-containing protein [Collinsella aerofaciens]|uniref:LPXTG cell wall anchor domain-containing protein n=1 Tax=Collinsella aerofaciens TaxID=74426 RepID=UPI001896D3C6|nr:LPXTG cell wall anchor domain-containing protein [Collinsella aerofaciens]MDB1829759.1 LPXTG cell wall anchor domain-containing protein [Collinsella aerofaciens]
MNDILARRARRATMGIALSLALAAGIAPVTAIAAETSSPIDAAALQTATANSSETATTEKDKAYAAMQEALKNLEAAKDAASPEKLAEIDDDIAAFQELYDMVVAEAAKWRVPLPAMQANVDAAQAKYDEAHNRVSELQAELKKAYDNGDYAAAQQLRSEIMSAERQEKSCKSDLDSYRRRLEIQEGQVEHFESAAEEAKAHIDEDIAKRNALTDDLEKAQAAYDDACKAYEEAKAAADKATSPEITQPTETTPPSGSTQPAETAQPASSPATGKDTAPSSSKQANTGNSKQANTTAGKLANTGDTTPSAIALAGIAAMGLGITATATRRIKNSK